MAISVADFTTRLAESGLMTAEEVGVVIAELSVGQSPPDVEALARQLVKQKKLTAYQAQTVYQGKGRSLLLGNYVILDKLGQGGMGMVLKAEHKRMKRLVALKVLSPAVTKTPDAMKRFQREVEAAAKLQHPNIVSAFDADEVNGTHFLVMEYVEGTDLSVLVKKQGPLSVEKAVACIVQAARGLEFAHQQGVIHRDIKPANLLVDAKGTVKILDMGLARIEGETGAQAELTSTGAVMGTVDYMAPEQALSTKHADARSDIYSLGISLWYLLTGKCAYDGDTLMAKLLAHRDAPIPSLCSMRNEVPPAVDTVFRKMVAKQAKDRYQTMTEVIRDLEGCLSGQSSSVKVNLPQSTDDSQFNAFLNNFDTSPGASMAATKSRLSKAPPTVMDSAAEATLLTGDMTQPTDPQTLTSFGSLAGRKGTTKQKPGQRRAASASWWQDRRLQVGGGVAVLLMGLIWFLIPPRQNSATNPSSKQKTKSTETAKTGQSKDSAEKKALDWLFSVGAKVGVGQQGWVEPARSTVEALASGKPVVDIALDGRPISNKDLAQLSAFPSIYGLSFSTCEIGDKGVAQIAELPQLQILVLSRTKVTDRDLAPLLKCRSLHTLHLDGTSVTSEGLATIGQILSLTDLNLGALPITDQSLTSLQKLSLLRNLNIEGCQQLTDECGAALAPLPALYALNASHTGIGERALRDLSKSRTLRGLLLFNCQKLTDECGTALAQFLELENLNLGSTSIGDRALQGLSKSRSLRVLEIAETQATDAAIPSLSQMKSLTTLDIQRTKFTADGVKQLVAAMPWCEIVSSHGVFKPTEKVTPLTAAAVIDPPQYALDFNYKMETGNARVELPPMLRPFEPCTVEMYVTTRSVLDKWDNRVLFISGGGMQLLQQKNNWSWSWSVPSKDGTYNRVIVDGSVLARRRMHLAGVSTGKELRLFIDGHLAGKTPLVGDLPLVAGPCLLGGLAANFDGFTPFDGLIDEVRISKGARYNENFTPAPRFEADADTLAVYHFDEGQGEILKDSSGNNHHGKIVGAKWVKFDGLPIDVDRRAAEWVLSIGGDVVVNGGQEHVRDVGALPKDALKLDQVFLAGNKKLSDAGLANLKDRQNLREINLRETLVSDAGLAHLAKLPRLDFLGLQGTSVGDAGLALLGNDIDIEATSLCFTPVTAKGLARLKGWKHLIRLHLDGTPVSTEGLAHLKDCKKLRYLHIQGTGTTDAGLAHMQECQSLLLLYVAENPQVTEAGIAKLHQALPKCRIRWDGGFIEPNPAVWDGWPTDAPKPAVAPFDAAQAKKHQEEWAAYLKLPVEYTNSIGMEFPKS